MKKAIVIISSINLLLLFVILFSFIFKDTVLNRLVNSNRYKIAAVFYKRDAIMDEITKKTYNDIANDVNLVIEKDNDKSINDTNNEYDDIILKKDIDDNYKYIELDINGYKSYIVAIYDPSKVKLIRSRSFNSNNTGQETIKSICTRIDASVCINGGGFVDYGEGSDIPRGLVISDGNIIWNETGKSELIGFNHENKLMLMKVNSEEAIKAGYRDALQFGPYLIRDGEILVNKYTYVGGYLGASRVAIAQREDGIVLFFVSDGYHGYGLSVYDVANTLKKYGAVTAANLDGGASSSLVVDGVLKNKPMNIYRNLIIDGRTVVTGFGLVK